MSQFLMPLNSINNQKIDPMNKNYVFKHRRKIKPVNDVYNFNIFILKNCSVYLFRAAHY
jgi:hypothetical protein